MELVKVIAVREAILLCMKHGIDGADSQLNSFDNSKPNRLSTKDQINALQKNLECIYKNVEIIGSGKRGKVILSSLKEEVSAKEDGRADNEGQPTPNEQIIMNQYIFNCLNAMYKKGSYMDYSLTGWSKQFGLLNTEEIPTARFERRISEVHANTPFNRIKTSEVVRVFKTDTIYNRNKQVTESALKRLKKSGEIDYVKHFNVVDNDDKRRMAEVVEYEDIKLARRELLESLGSSIGAYNYAIGNPSPSGTMKDILDKVSKMLITRFNCKFIYESIEVTSVMTQDDYSVSKEEFREAYWARLITLTDSRQRAYDNAPKGEQTWFWKKFYCYNTLVLMEYMGIDSGGLLLDYEIGNVERANDLSVAFDAWGNRDRPNGFGS